jgi:TolB-like protein
VNDAPTEREGEGAWIRLRRRKVVQWGLAYAAVAWTLLQLIEYFGETYAWPPAIRQIAALALPLGTLFVLVVAWYHGDKGAQEVSRPEVAILAVLALGVGATLWTYASRLDETAWESQGALPDIRHVVPKDAASVAVLPFVDMSEAHDQEYFADGLSEEILNALAAIPGLFVPARTSSFQFKGKRGDVAKFAALLGVASVLEGSVRKSGNRVRITAQLINARDGYRLWSQTFDRELTDIFAIQEEISRAIADALEVKLTAQQKVATARTPPTANLDAYEEYLLGRFEFNKRGQTNAWNAIAHFEAAIALDPKFALAYADLAVVEQMYGRPEWGSASSEEHVRRRTTEPRSRVERALALEPGRPEVLAAAGYVDFREGSHRWKKELLERALDYFDRSLALWPNSGEVLNWKAYTLAALSRYEEVVRVMKEAAKRDPLNMIPVNNHAIMLYLMGQTSEAAAVVERLRALNPVVAQDEAVFGEMVAGNRAKGVRLALEAADSRQPGDVNYADARVQLATLLAGLDLRDEVFGAEILTEAFKRLGWWRAHMLFYECREALALIDKEGESGVYVEAWDYVLPFSCAADYGLVEEVLQLSVHPRTHWVVDHPMESFLGWNAQLLLIADALRRTGHGDDARVWRDIADRMISGKARAGYRNYFEQAMLYAYDGRDDEAVQKLIAAIPYGNNWRAAAAIPLVSPLTKRPEYQEAMKKERAVLDRQRAEVLEMLCGPEPVSKTYKPAPATCAKRNTP